MNTHQMYGSGANSRSSFIFLKDINGFKAYVMTLIADSSYIKNNPDKLANNTYRKRDANYSGLVLYFTPEGKFVNGYRYINGQLVTPATNTDKNTLNNKLKTNTTQPGGSCIDWFLDTYIDGALVSEVYLYTTCTTDGGNSGGGGGVPPDPCTGQKTNAINKTTVNSITVQQTQPQDPPVIDGDGGLPPPIDPNTSPCSTGQDGGGNGKNTTPNFGIDNNCLNCRVPDDKFDELLAYAASAGLTVNNPYNTTVTDNGVIYAGQATLLTNSNNEIVAAYFSPDVSGGPFQTGMEYTIGNKGPDGTNSNTTTNTSLEGIVIGPSSTYLGNGPITYTPPHGGDGAILTLAQRQAFETADNQRLINLMTQEDAQDDAAMSPCHGTARNGNVKWPGTAEHWLIQFDYMANNPTALREYFIPGSSGKLTGAAGYADIADPSTNQMFEIKPDNTAGQTAGMAEVQLYVTQGNALCPPPNGGAWAAGGNYPTRYLPDPRNSSNLLQARLFSNGVIVYVSIPRNNQPAPQPVALPQNLADKLRNLFQNIKANPTTQQQQVITFVRQNPKIVPYLKSASAGIIIGTILEDIASDGIGILDDWESFVIARTLWRVANGIVII
ncbi:hypothetical protein G7092_27825 [Mucilaginibacter sp. HC2]|uniref:hypothetical protein n=1 Tax=Mucilaginibacter inviolabilis TaxID=2714892 RepID=UPI0014097FC3|nr:hypothetical protein [Mucilaginibacter inviolabilis]NHA07640.1 hypothetical protein [Mucilaginibacter inviolabilis]